MIQPVHLQIWGKEGLRIKKLSKAGTALGTVTTHLALLEFGYKISAFSKLPEISP